MGYKINSGRISRLPKKRALIYVFTPLKAKNRLKIIRRFQKTILLSDGALQLIFAC